MLLFGFNHAEAVRCFERAIDCDPTSPMPWWGIAYAHGMNINDPIMTDARWKAATAAADQAIRLRDNATPKERMLIDAVAARYSWPAPAEQRDLDEAYMRAMRRAHEQYSSDHDIASLYAESMMNLQPWDYWTVSGEPKGAIEEVIEVLEGVLADEPDHPSATHFYIHAVEASNDPFRAIAVADALADRVPGAGHLVHMPSHIYVRVGQYADAADANVRAAAVDRAFFDANPEPGLYWLYYMHNLHFIAFTSMMECRYEPAIAAARRMEEEAPEEMLREYGGLVEGIMATTYHVLIRFGKWEEILEEEQRPEYRLVSRAVHHYARGIAYSALDQPAEAREEMALFEEAWAKIPEDWWVFNNRVDQVLPIARAMLEGELAFREGRHEDAFAALKKGIAAEDALVYDEPPAWMLPVRHPLGAFYMSTGRYADAEAVYREDQKRHLNNGWSLLGLEQALAAQGKAREAAEVRSLLAKAWARAELAPTASCLCEPKRQWNAGSDE